MISYDTNIGTRGLVTVPLTEESFGKRTGDARRSTLYEEGPWLYKRNKSVIGANLSVPTGPVVVDQSNIADLIQSIKEGLR